MGRNVLNIWKQQLGWDCSLGFLSHSVDVCDMRRIIDCLNRKDPWSWSSSHFYKCGSWVPGIVNDLSRFIQPVLHSIETRLSVKNCDIKENSLLVRNHIQLTTTKLNQDVRNCFSLMGKPLESSVIESNRNDMIKCDKV